MSTLGDFTQMAAHYVHRTGYCPQVIRMLSLYTGAHQPGEVVADVGAGTGKLTENLLAEKLQVVPVEPNEAMRNAGSRYLQSHGVEFREGSGENTGLPDNFARWVLMGSSFHWVDTARGLAEFHRVLKPGGYFTAVWNPRDLDAHPIHARVEARIYEIAPDIKRVSSGAAAYTQTIAADLISTGQFRDVVFVEGYHEVKMSKSQYLGAWHSVNDIQVQAGPERWLQILNAIEDEISNEPEVITRYKTRSWTVQSIK